MDADRNEQTSPPIMCKNNCGFCGSPANENYCSKCYREHLKNKSQIVNKAPETDKKHGLTVDSADSAASTLETAEQPEKKAKVENQRCFTCKKMVGLLGFSCRCGNVFCGLHRQSNIHDCQFDYKSYNRQQLERKSVKVVRDKLERI